MSASVILEKIGTNIKIFTLPSYYHISYHR